MVIIIRNNISVPRDSPLLCSDDKWKGFDGLLCLLEDDFNFFISKCLSSRIFLLETDVWTNLLGDSFDTFLNFFSSNMLGSECFSVISSLSESEDVDKKLAFLRGMVCSLLLEDTRRWTLLSFVFFFSGDSFLQSYNLIKM